MAGPSSFGIAFRDVNNANELVPEVGLEPTRF